MKKLLTRERLDELFHFGADRGTMTRKVSRPGSPVGTVVGSPNTAGYLQVMVDRRMYYVHRLIFFYFTGQYPRADLDHRDGNKSNNKLSNLRVATRRQNIAKARGYGSSGYRGVKRVAGGFSSAITVRGKYQYLGFSKDPLQVFRLYRLAHVKAYGDFSPYMTDKDLK